MIFLANSSKHLKESEWILHNLFGKTEEEGRSPTHFMKPVLSWHQNQTKKAHTEKKRDRSISLMNSNAKFPNKILANWF
jgi:hypothetical protein